MTRPRVRQLCAQALLVVTQERFAGALNRGGRIGNLGQAPDWIRHHAPSFARIIAAWCCRQCPDGPGTVHRAMARSRRR